MSWIIPDTFDTNIELQLGAACEVGAATDIRKFPHAADELFRLFYGLRNLIVHGYAPTTLEEGGTLFESLNLKSIQSESGDGRDDIVQHLTRLYHEAHTYEGNINISIQLVLSMRNVMYAVAEEFVLAVTDIYDIPPSTL